MTRTTTTRPASDKQIAFIDRLLSERDTTGSVFAGHTQAPVALTTQQASAAIEGLLALPWATTSPSAAPGYYIQGETMIVVVENKAKTNTYAKALTNHPKSDGSAHWTWDYAPGVGRTLAGLAPLTIQQAAAFGHLYGICFKCLRPLTDPKSVAAGMGPVCAKSL